MALYCSPECTGYAALEQARKHMTLCCISFHPCRSIRKVLKMGRVDPVSSFEDIRQYLSTRCCIPSFKVISLLVPKKERFEGFYHIWAWTPSWSCDPEHLNKYSSQHPWRPNMKFGFKRPCVFLGKEFWKCWIWVTLDKGQWMTLTLDCHKSSCTHLFDYMYQLSPHSLEIYSSSIFPYKNKRVQIWPSCKVG